jgi:5-methylcytosine-specific restriction endonuclease McrA
VNKATIKHIVNALRQASTSWEGRNNCLKKHRKAVFVRKSLAGKDIFKFHWQCVKCKRWYKDIEKIEVDHIVEVGKMPTDLAGLMETIGRMYDEKNLQTMCIDCHLEKTVAKNAMWLYERKRKLATDSDL